MELAALYFGDLLACYHDLLILALALTQDRCECLCLSVCELCKPFKLHAKYSSERPAALKWPSCLETLAFWTQNG